MKFRRIKKNALRRKESVVAHRANTVAETNLVSQMRKRIVGKEYFFFIFPCGTSYGIYFDWREGKTTSKCSTKPKTN